MENFIFIAYFIVAAVVVFFSVKCADYVDLLDKKSNISGAFIGGIILAAVTSLPELITSISSIFVVHNPELIIGNVLGSNVFNLCIFGGLVLVSTRYFCKATVAKSHLATAVCTLVAYAGCAAATFTGFGTIPGININVVSLLILVVYVISFRFLSNDDSETEDDSNCNLTVKQIVTRFILAAIGLVVASIVITYITDQIADKLNLNASLAGALFLGIATSLPELTSSIALVRKKNYNAMIGNVVGSNMFNFTILTIADILTWHSSVYIPSSQTMYMVIFGVVSTLLISLALILKRRQPEQLPKIAPVLFGIFSFLILVSYASFLVLSM